MIVILISLGLTGCSNSEAKAARYAAEAQYHLDQNAIADARLAIKQAIITRDDVSEYHILRGRIEYAASSFENAYAAYSEALALDATSMEALQAVSQIGIRVGRYDESIDATNKLLVLNPNQTDALLMRGLHALIKRDYTAATATADQILSVDRLNEGGVVLKARASFLAGKPEEAARILDVFELSRPDTLAVSLTRLEIYRTLREPEQMKRQFLILARMRPNDLALQLDNANFYYKIGNDEEATKLVASVMAKSTASTENVTSAVRLWKEYSVVMLGAALIKPLSQSGTAAARIAGARYFADAGNLATASLILGRLQGNDADAERANIALLDGNKSLASRLIETILARDETHCSALGTQAALWAESRKYADALRSAQTAASECPDQPAYWQLAARVYSDLGDNDNARRVFRQGTQANQQSQPLTRAYSHWLLEQGFDREALAAARRLTRSAPALTSAWQLYLEICSKTQSTCVAEARQGLIDSETRYGIDLLPGELPPNGLFGRLVIR